jgi:hypothetical protein
MRPVERHKASYQVVVLGELVPEFLAFCAPARAGDSQTSSVFQLRVQDGQGIADLAAMLQAAGLMILSIRQVSVRETSTATGSAT